MSENKVLHYCNDIFIVRRILMFSFMKVILTEQIYYAMKMKLFLSIPFMLFKA